MKTFLSLEEKNEKRKIYVLVCQSWTSQKCEKSSLGIRNELLYKVTSRGFDILWNIQV